MGDSKADFNYNIDDPNLNNGINESSKYPPPSYPDPDNGNHDPSEYPPNTDNGNGNGNGSHHSYSTPPSQYPSYPNPTNGNDNGAHYSSKVSPKSSPYHNNGTYDSSKVSYYPAYPSADPINGGYDSSNVPNAYPSPYQAQNRTYPPPSPFAQQPPRQMWSSGLFDCHLDDTNCAATAVSPCITFGQIAEIVDEGQTSCAMAGSMFSILIACPWIYTFSYRTRLRKKYNLEEAPIMDALVHFLFLPCALCQEYRELKSRGLHPGLGWAGNQERPLPNAGMAAPPNQAMRR